MHQLQLTLNMKSGLSADAATNTWYVDADDDTNLGLFRDSVLSIYDAISASLSFNIDRLKIDSKFYRLSDPTPRLPILETTETLPSVGTTAAPTEQALVLSYQAAPVSGLPQARRRGRVYFGPWAVGALDANGRVSNTLISSLVNAAAQHKTNSDNAVGWTWAQYSPTNGTGADVASGWVDNAWDTQRRRGLLATARTTF